MQGVPNEGRQDRMLGREPRPIDLLDRKDTKTCPFGRPRSWYLRLALVSRASKRHDNGNPAARTRTLSTPPASQRRGVRAGASRAVARSARLTATTEQYDPAGSTAPAAQASADVSSARTAHQWARISTSSATAALASCASNSARGPRPKAQPRPQPNSTGSSTRGSSAAWRSRRALVSGFLFRPRRPRFTRREYRRVLCEARRDRRRAVFP